MRVLHPSDAIGDLDMRPRRNRTGVVVGGTLNIDNAREYLIVAKEQTGSAIGAEVAPAMLRRRVNLGGSLRNLDALAGIHGPAHHGCACMASTVRAVAKRVREGPALRRIANGATMTAAVDGHAPSPCKIGAGKARVRAPAPCMLLDIGRRRKPPRPPQPAGDRQLV